MDRDAARTPYAACPLCDGADLRADVVADCSHHPLYQPALPAEQQWLRCGRCGHSFTDGYFTPAALQVLFANTNEHQTVGHNAEQTRYVSARMVEGVVRELGRSEGRWLDIGFGNGSLLTTAAEFGFEPVGIDARESSVAQLRTAGIEAHAVEFEAFAPDRACDVISMADVLEHMPFPLPALRHAHRLLNQNGVLFVSMPNADAPLWEQLNRQHANPYWGEIEHYHNFGRSRLYALLRACGFEPAEYRVSERYRVCMEIISTKSAPS